MMFNFNRSQKGFCFLLVLLLIFQLNALSIHEYNLHQQGYTLIHVEPWNLGELPESTTFSKDGKDFYNTALCQTHFRIEAVSKFPALGLVVLILAGFLSALTINRLRSYRVRNDYFLSSIVLRAPPVTLPA